MSSREGVPATPAGHFELFLDDHGWRRGASSETIQLWFHPSVEVPIQILRGRAVTVFELDRHLRVMGLGAGVFLKWLRANPAP